MGSNERSSRLGGIFNIVVTPFNKDGTLNKAALVENIERVIAIGYDGLLIGGTYGEFATMTPDERAELFRLSMDATNSRVPVLLCSASSEVSTARQLTELADELGGIPMVMPPFVSEITNGQIVSFFAEMAGSAKSGMVVYNAPGTGITLSAALIEQISDIDAVIGLKQGDLTPTVIDTLVGRLKGKISLLCASDLAFLGPMSAGFDGISSTNSCALPELILEAYRAIAEGDARRAGELQRSWYELRELIRKNGQPQTTKAMMNARGFIGGHVRAPLKDLQGRVLEELSAALKRCLAHSATK